ncbi:MAG: UDP-N-acetylmuramoyl-L-alanyl-D-glutamate--2,6-diaminopimelate ligase [Bacteroidales bacterium]|nr:UDP-N-acetylmuramoyl-L-alanyl-D-glutamate--2,6-diaminopimelate ligase [Bacteroidales bacterium]
MSKGVKNLADILKGIPYLEIKGDPERQVRDIIIDSRQVSADSLFAALPGTLTDGHRFIPDAIRAGAGAVICEEFPEELPGKVTFIRVESSHQALGMVASAFYDHPSDYLKLVGVTGTNGKTSTVSLLYQIFGKLGYKAGLVSTIRNISGTEVIPSTHTTPDPVGLNALLARMVDSGCSHCFMEVSSHAVDQRRIAGLTFAGGVFTNITRDHLDYHLSFSNYIRVKQRFFDDLPADAFALVNSDDRNARIMIQNCRAGIRNYSLKHPSEFRAKIIENHWNGLHLNIGGNDVWCPLIGSFNAYNLLAAYATAVIMGEEPVRVLAAISSVEAIEGRFEYVRSQNNVLGIVDYAHSPDALENVLKTISNIRTGNETLFTVFGAGGDRDHGKRPLMGRIATRWSNRVILTSDNPRSEDPMAIIEEIRKGIPLEERRKVLTIPQREEAIKNACMMARPGDIILLAGKGHEKYQEIQGNRYPFDDKEMLQRYLLTLINST